MSRDLKKLKFHFIHCSDTKPDWMKDATPEAQREEIRRWHTQERGWSDIGYNFIIARDGSLLGGRDLDNDGDYFEEIGAHVAGYNSRAIGTCLIGGHGAKATDKFFQHFTSAQSLTLMKHIDTVNEMAGKKLTVMGHNEVAAKACPGFQVSDFMEGKLT